MRRLIYALTIATPCLACPTVAPGAVLFPVIVSQPDAGREAAGRAPSVAQTVRSDGAVRITAETPIPYKPRILDRKLLGGGRGLTLKAGTVLVRARLADGDAYCAAVAPKPEGMMNLLRRRPVPAGLRPRRDLRPAAGLRADPADPHALRDLGGGRPAGLPDLGSDTGALCRTGGGRDPGGEDPHQLSADADQREGGGGRQPGALRAS